MLMPFASTNTVRVLLTITVDTVKEYITITILTRLITMAMSTTEATRTIMMIEASTVALTTAMHMTTNGHITISDGDVDDDDGAYEDQVLKLCAIQELLEERQNKKQCPRPPDQPPTASQRAQRASVKPGGTPGVSLATGRLQLGAF